jgi:hypothetical protein
MIPLELKQLFNEIINIFEGGHGQIESPYGKQEASL